MRILIIEDDKSLAETLRFQLEHNNFETDVCHDGEEGLHYIEQQAHDLILLDRMIPGLDGISVLKITREKNISTPIIFVTALGALNDKITGLDCGADDYLVKPFDFEELPLRRASRKGFCSAVFSDQYHRTSPQDVHTFKSLGN